MAYYNIEKRLKSDGTPRYRCTVLIKEKGVITFRESKTFPNRRMLKHGEPRGLWNWIFMVSRHLMMLPE